MIQTILFATDLGPHTHYLLHHVEELAQQHKAEIIVVHAMEPPGHLGDAVVQAYWGIENKADYQQDNMADVIDGVKRRIVDMLEDEFIAGHEGLSGVRGVHVVQGKPADVILDEAIKNQADMIILGSHSEANASENILGSVTSKVLQLSRLPVYMVPLVRNLVPEAAA